MADPVTVMLVAFASILVVAMVGYAIIVVTDKRRRGVAAVDDRSSASQSRVIG